MIIATRRLTIESSTTEMFVDVSVYSPELSDGMWMCRYKIEWPRQARASFAAGVDSIQAIHLALQKIGMELYVSPYHSSGCLKWEKIGDGYGFPVPKDGRDMLVGSDQLFDG